MMSEKKHECCECGWSGFDFEKNVTRLDSIMRSLDCPNCGNDSFYLIDNEVDIAGSPDSDAIRFGNWLNRNAEKWGDEWALEDGRNYTTAQCYRKFQEQ